MDGFLNIHIWIGTTDKPEQEYLKYFELDYSTEGDFDDPGYKLCEFCKDTNTVWYNEDFIGIIPLFDRQMDVSELLGHLPLHPQDADEGILKCGESGISSGNAVFYFIDFDSETIVQKPYKENYNDLKYIGKFSSSLRR